MPIRLASSNTAFDQISESEMDLDYIVNTLMIPYYLTD